MIQKIDKEFSVNVGIYDVFQINYRFDRPKVKLLAFALLCYAKQYSNSLNEISIYPLHLFCWLNTNSMASTNRNLKEIVDYEFMININDTTLKNPIKSVYNTKGLNYKILIDLNKGGLIKVNNSNFIDVFNECFNLKSGDRGYKLRNNTPEENLKDIRDSARFYAQKRKAKKLNCENTLTKEQWNCCMEFFDNSCAYCGESSDICQEHFVALNDGGGYSIKNIIPSCRGCNSSKGAKLFEKWYIGYKYYSKERYDKIDKYFKLIKEGEMQSDSD